ncbi:hypothetical protein FACS189487_10900 [Campylobacterota bacterium]|nr:hypothetical protein FACS189487_10900 [Campylobacterota bacterium]
MTQSTLSVRLDTDTKKAFDTFCSDVGMNASVAVNVFIKATLREKRLPFEVAQNSISELHRRIADANAGRNMTAHEPIEAK